MLCKDGSPAPKTSCDAKCSGPPSWTMLGMSYYVWSLNFCTHCVLVGKEGQLVIQETWTIGKVGFPSPSTCSPTFCPSSTKCGKSYVFVRGKVSEKRMVGRRRNCVVLFLLLPRFLSFFWLPISFQDSWSFSRRKKKRFGRKIITTFHRRPDNSQNSNRRNPCWFFPPSYYLYSNTAHELPINGKKK